MTGPIGIMGAMAQEVATLRAGIRVESVRSIAHRDFVAGELFGRRVILVESHWGKVAAAVTATHLIADFGVAEIIFTGVAGALDPSLRVGDIVVADRLYQHDLDASPIFPPMQIPALGIDAIPATPALRDRLFAAAQRFLRDEFSQPDSAAGHDHPRAIDPETRRAFGLTAPKVIRADIATGDRFISSRADADTIRRRIPTAACVEMEGGAVAQVCFEHGVPFAVVRTISDTADHAAPVDFPRFLGGVTGHYAEGIVRRYLA